MIRYQGVLYEYHYECYLSQTQDFHQAGQMLGYRGIFYSQEIRSPEYSPEVSPLTPPLSSYLNYRIHHRHWQKNRHQHLLQFQPRLVSRWIYYRRGLITNEPDATAATVELWKLGHDLTLALALSTRLRINLARIKVSQIKQVKKAKQSACNHS